MSKKTALLILAVTTSALLGAQFIYATWFVEHVTVPIILAAHYMFGMTPTPSPSFIARLNLAYSAIVIVLALYFLNLIVSIYRK